MYGVDMDSNIDPDLKAASDPDCKKLKNNDSQTGLKTVSYMIHFAIF